MATGGADIDSADIPYRSGSSVAAAWTQLLGQLLGQADEFDGVELALEPVGVGVLVANDLFEDVGGPMVAEVVALRAEALEVATAAFSLSKPA